MVLHLLVDQVIDRNLELLFLGVPGNLQNLHAVSERGRNGIEDVGRGDEEHLRQIERHVEIVIPERVVLLGIEHFEQRRGGIAAEVRAELVDLVEDEHGVFRLGAAQALHDLTGEGADIGAPVAADFGLVAHAAERHPHQLSAERLSDRTCERRLADARRPDEAEDRALDVRIELADGEVLENAVFHFLEARVVRVEDVLGDHQVDDVVGPLVPRQRDEPVEIGPRHRVLGRGNRHLR